MDDPWGSPWDTSNEHGATTAISLVPPPPAVALSTSTSKQTSAPWGEEEGDNAWGGWNGASAPGADSPGWGRSPGLKPMASLRSRSVSPVPWTQKADDSGIGLGLEADAPAIALVRPQPIDPHRNRDDGLSDSGEAHSEGQHERESKFNSPTRTESPEGSPPGPALRAERPPEIGRKESKVQELVDMYDGISRLASPMDKTLPSLESPLEVPREADESEGESSSVASTASSRVPEQTLKRSIDEPPSPPAESDDFGDQTVIVCEAAYTEPDLADDLPAPVPSTNKVVPIPLPVDLSLLDDLFPSTHESATAPEPLPPNIIDDTFSTPGERRTWYRVSRFGSSRKHNHGNDENYVHVDWARSAARIETLQIVRRWMEEDSIAGRGMGLAHRARGAIGGGKMFGWDRAGIDVDPVDVDALLKRTRRANSREERPRTASFGWSSPCDSPVTSAFPQAAFVKSRPQSMVPAANSAVDQERIRPKSLVIPPPISMERPSIDTVITPTLDSPGSTHSRAPVHGIAAEETEDDDDDDDWGEMVTSPTGPTSAEFDVPLVMGNSSSAAEGTPAGNGILRGSASIGNEASSPTASVLSSVRSAKPSSPLKLEAWSAPAAPIQLTLPPISSQRPPLQTESLEPSPSLSPAPITSSPAQPAPAGSTKLATTHQVVKHPRSQKDEDTATNILRNLTDLTYMLR